MQLKIFFKKTNKTIIFIIISIFFLAITLIIGFSFALFQKSNEATFINGTVREFCHDCIVSFDSNTGNVITTTLTLKKGDFYGTLPTPTKDNNEFLGWYTLPTDGDKITSDTISNLDLNQTLYAHWQEVESPEITGGTTDWTTSATISINSNGTAFSGVKHYEYYTTTSDTLPTNTTTATGTTSNTISITTEGKTYTYYRTVSNQGIKSKWSDAQIVYLRTNILLADAIKQDNALVTSSPTLTSTSYVSKEIGLYKSNATNTGNYTFYYRGPVNNNYISFANYTWRIVRINEDGTIRLIMETPPISSQYNLYANSLVYMYYSTGTSANTAKYELEKWYSTNIQNKGYGAKVASGGYFCEQAKVKESSYAGSASMVYYTNYTPDFKCATDGNGKGIVSSSVGLITYDEVAFAGGYGYEYSDTYIKTTSVSYWWTMSPAGVDDNARLWTISNAGAPIKYYAASVLPLRPVINLNANTYVTGSGKSNNQYIVK